MKTGLILSLAVVALIVGSQYVGTRSRLAAERAAIDAAWAQVDAALDHRAAAAADLVEAMPSGAPPEQTAVHTFREARAALARARGPQQKIQANAQLDFALSRLLLAAESDPKLEASKNFSELLDALKDAEYHIAVERRKYNEAVQHYNTGIALFPNNIVASLSGFGKIDVYFQTAAGAQ